MIYVWIWNKTFKEIATFMINIINYPLVPIMMPREILHAEEGKK